MTSRELARLLDHTSKDSDRWTAADQMAIDQMLLQDAGVRRRPTLRFYVWSKPTLSLGYFQQAAWADAYLQSQMATADVALVRRSTGGGAILHDRELTYSLTWPNGVGGHSQTTGARDDLYRAIHDAVIRGLMEFEVRVFAYRDTSLKAVTRSKSAEATEDAFLCFQRRSPDDLICNG
ncbi:MAG: lipoate--protein ligase family protein, partial [Planctomycetota bacterium]